MAAKKKAEMTELDKKIAAASPEEQMAYARLFAQANSDANRITGHDGWRSAEEMARRGREDGKAVRVISVPDAQEEITYEEALRIAVNCWDEVDYVTEYEDAYVFSRYDDMSFGGNSPVAVMKADGRAINFVAFLDSGCAGDPIREGYITAR